MMYVYVQMGIVCVYVTTNNVCYLLVLCVYDICVCIV